MKSYILMADVIRSSQKNSNILMKNFKEIAQQTNTQLKDAFYSPITITLGDEFQSVVRSLKDGISVIIAFEELIIKCEKNFRLRYVLNYGEIGTPINKQRAHEMLGQGLIDAREMLDIQKHKDSRFFIKDKDHEISEKLNLAFYIYQSFIDSWRLKDYQTIWAFLEHEDYKVVARVLKKDVSLMWRREKTLNISEYSATKKLINLITE